MTPPTFRIGDQVEITGPTIVGCKLHSGEKFTITQAIGVGYTGNGFPWYPASSLRLIEEPKIGDWVAVLNDGCGKKTGDVFCIDRIVKERIPGDPGPYYSAEKWPLYSMSELRKLSPSEIEEHLKPELKIGDWVEVIGPALGGSENERGKIFKITQDTTMCAGLSTFGMAAYRPKSLRKLTPDEINQHRTGDCRQALTKACIELNLPYNRPPMETIEAMLSMIAIDREDSKYGEVMERLSAIEKQVADIKKQMFEFRNLMMEIETRMDERVDEQQKSIDVVGREIKGRTFDKTPIAEILRRLDFIEAFQKDEAKHAAYTTYTYKPGEEGTITVHCSCGQKYEIEATPRRTRS